MRFCEHEGCNQPVFGTCKVSRKGFCKRHQSDRVDFDKRTIMQKAIEKQKGIVNKVRALPHITESKKEELSELDKWFDMVATFIKANPHCENCGEFIPEEISRFTSSKIVKHKNYRNASAHIIPKGLFPSVSTHPLNFLILSASCGCHSEFDSSIENASKMRIWPKAVERFKLILPSVKETHKYIELFKEKIIP